jgi:hypothetical protein
VPPPTARPSTWSGGSDQGRHGGEHPGIGEPPGGGSDRRQRQRRRRVELGQQPDEALGQHRLARARGPDEQHVVAAGRGNRARVPRVVLPHHAGQIGGSGVGKPARAAGRAAAAPPPRRASAAPRQGWPPRPGMLIFVGVVIMVIAELNDFSRANQNRNARSCCGRRPGRRITDRGGVRPMLGRARRAAPPLRHARGVLPPPLPIVVRRAGCVVYRAAGRTTRSRGNSGRAAMRSAACWSQANPSHTVRP